MTSGPFILGLTGSIGMGKSTTANMFAQAGVPVWDADAAVHRLYAKGGAAVSAMNALYPAAVINGEISRDALKSWIAADDTALKQIEQIIHPLVAQDRRNFIQENADHDLIVLDIPLLFETGAQSRMDAVVVVTAPADIQRRRVLERGTMTPAQFEHILSKQVPDAQKRAQADFIIQTTDMESAQASVNKVLASIREKLNA